MLGHDFNSWGVETRRGSSPPLRRTAPFHVHVHQWAAHPGPRRAVAATALSVASARPASQQSGRGESGWCLDMTSTHAAWRHVRVRFLLPGGLQHSMYTCANGLLTLDPAVPLRPQLCPWPPPGQQASGAAGVCKCTQRQPHQDDVMQPPTTPTTGKSKGRSGTPSELQGPLLSIMSHYPTTADSA